MLSSPAIRMRHACPCNSPLHLPVPTGNSCQPRVAQSTITTGFSTPSCRKANLYSDRAARRRPWHVVNEPISRPVVPDRVPLATVRAGRAVRRHLQPHPRGGTAEGRIAVLLARIRAVAAALVLARREGRHRVSPV